MISHRPSPPPSPLPATHGVRRSVLLANLLLAVVYFLAICLYFPIGNPVVFSIFLIGEVFHLWQLSTYLYTVWWRPVGHAFDDSHAPPVDLFITVCGEPLHVIRATILGALSQDYPGLVSIAVLNDGFAAGRSNWRQVEQLADRMGVACITRQQPGGAKAGNINHALALRNAPLVAVFDADHVPEPQFLSRTVGYFTDVQLGFVQTPQFYINHDVNYVAGGAWEQQDLFFGPIQSGKDAIGAAFMCGTNMVIRREALDEVGGLCQTNIAEDFLTSLLLHERGWKSVYVQEVLARGLAPEDFLSYYKQQHRWARGSLEVIFRYNPLVRRGLTWPQRIQYLASASYYLSGPVVLMNAVLPLLFFGTGLTVFNISTNALAAVFIPYICLSLYVLQRSTSFTYTFRALAFSMGSFWLQTSALFSVLTGRKTAFAVTSKSKLSGSFLKMVIPQLAYLVLTLVGVTYAALREGFTASVVTNASWALITCILFLPTIFAASSRGAASSALAHTSVPLTAGSAAAEELVA